MKTLIATILIYAVTVVGYGQTTPAPKFVGKAKDRGGEIIRATQDAANAIWAEQDRYEREMANKIAREAEWHSWYRKDGKTSTGKFIWLKDGKALIYHKTNGFYQQTFIQMDAPDQRYIRDEMAYRSGKKKRPVKKEPTPVQVPVQKTEDKQEIVPVFPSTSGTPNAKKEKM